MNAHEMGLAALCRPTSSSTSGPLSTLEPWILLAGMFGGAGAALYGLGYRKPLWAVGGASTAVISWLIGRAEILGK